MATKAATKRKRKPAKAATKPEATRHTISNHQFAPGTEVGIFPSTDITVERNLGREPIPDPKATAKVEKDGALSASGLEPGTYLAVGRVGDRYIYVGFSVK